MTKPALSRRSLLASLAAAPALLALPALIRASNAEAAEGTAKAALAQARERIRRNHPDLPTEFTAVRARPADALAERSRTAGVVVVGSRGRGGFRSLVMGSVSRGLAHLAESPVLIVHAAGREYLADA